MRVSLGQSVLSRCNIGIFPPSALLIDVAVAPPTLTHLTDSSVNGSDARRVPCASELPLVALLTFRNENILTLQIQEVGPCE